MSPKMFFLNLVVPVVFATLGYCAYFYIRNTIGCVILVWILFFDIFCL